jgi:hypothetical protein
MRLELNNAVQLFYGEVHTTTPMSGSDPLTIQKLIMNQMNPTVISFCNSNSKSSCGNNVTVKNVSAFEFLDTANPWGQYSRFVTFDIVVAVQ